MTAVLPPADDDRPATRRDLVKEREIIEAKFAVVNEKFAVVNEKFAVVNEKFEAVYAQIAGLRREMRILLSIMLVLWAAQSGLMLRGGG